MKVRIAAGPMEVEVEFGNKNINAEEAIAKTKGLFKEVIEEFAALGLHALLDIDGDPEGEMYG